MKKRKNRGYAIAELPGALMLLLLGFTLPLVIYGSLFYRVYCFNCLVKNSCLVGASQIDVPTATSSVQNYITSQPMIGITPAAPAVSTVKRTITYNQPGVGTQSYDAYFLQVTDTAQIFPLVAMPSFFGLSIPGLTGSCPFSMSTQCYFENQQALTGGS